jgi:hypothetical protein
MTKKNKDPDLGKDSSAVLPDISRRDYVNGTLVGFGSALLSSTAPAQAKSDLALGVGCYHFQ